MGSRLSKAPVFVFALAAVFALVGYAWSQNPGLDTNDGFPDAGASNLIGPPMPESMVTWEENAQAGPGESEEIVIAEPDGTPPEIALYMLQGSYDFDPALFEMVAERYASTSTQAAEIESESTDPVRVIEMPRREDPVDRFGEPVLPEDTYELAVLPTETAEIETASIDASAFPEDGIDHSFGGGAEVTLVPPVPASLDRRPVADPVQTGSIGQQVTSVAPQEAIPQNDQIIWPQRLDQVNGGPQRLDRVNAANRGVPPGVNAGPPVGNTLFMSDWVEVSQGHYRRIVPQ